VCVGGSAGGLDAYTRLLKHLPPDLGVAIVIVNHVRTFATLLHEILPRFTAMPVELITERLVIQPDHVFIIPEQHDLHVMDGQFRLMPVSKPRGWPDVITVFLRSLTEHWEGKLIAVIVSGYDGDGAAALCGIREVGGITIAQRPDTAKQPDMPESAIASGCIDFILSPEDIATELVRIAYTLLDEASPRARATPRVDPGAKCLGLDLKRGIGPERPNPPCSGLAKLAADARNVERFEEQKLPHPVCL